MLENISVGGGGGGINEQVTDPQWVVVPFLYSES